MIFDLGVIQKMEKMRKNGINYYAVLCDNAKGGSWGWICALTGKG